MTNGEFEKSKFCPITGQSINNLQKDNYGYYYEVQFLGHELSFHFCSGCFKRFPFDSIKHIVKGLVLNGRLKGIQENVIHWDSEKEGQFDLRKELELANYPRTAKEKIENVENELFKLQKYDGESVEIDSRAGTFHNFLYLKNSNEFIFYLNTLEAQGEIVIKRDGNASPKYYNFTFQGITNHIKRNEEGFNSNKCFIAMAFLPEMQTVRDSIKRALIETGFEPIIIDEKNIDSDRTINDEIISNLRKCKFCIADFSHHRNGVYFESGFALGQGKPVIYICEKAQFESAHFDIKPLQHIIYSTSEELQKRLVDKIEAWIK